MKRIETLKQLEWKLNREIINHASETCKLPIKNKSDIQKAHEAFAVGSTLQLVRSWIYAPLPAPPIPYRFYKERDKSLKTK